MHSAYVEASSKSMKLAGMFSLCNEGTSPDADGVKVVTANVDGSWQRRGYTSLNGVVTAIANGKCIDICKPCQRIARAVHIGISEKQALVMMNG